MTKGSANQLFILTVLLSLFSAVADLGMEITSNMAPMPESVRMICSISTYAYLTIRNANNVVLLLFLLALTRTTFLLRKKWVQITLCLPYICILVMLVQNIFTHNAFSVTAEEGYTRGPLMLAFYGIALFYGLMGLAYCIYCRRFLPLNKWSSLLAIYILAHLAVLIQFFYPKLLLEMFFTALGEMLIMLTIMRPEERMDSEVGMLSWASYQADLRNIILSREHVQIAVIQLLSCRELRNFLGDHSFNEYISEIANGIRALRWKHPYRIELYYERPGTIYLIADNDEGDLENLGQRLLSEANDGIKSYIDKGARFESQICLIHCPDDLQNIDDIISLGHTFQKHGSRRLTVFHARDILNSQAFTIEAHIEQILHRAIKENNIVVYYQPIFDLRSGSFHSAEALARIIDPEYGLISPAIFIPAAETRGFIIPIGDMVLEQVFRFVSEHDLNDLGLSYIEINLSVAQCMETDLPEKIHMLQQKYDIDPSHINLEITETTFENINDIMVENIEKLVQKGYSFALDDYGIGYSNIQRINHLPLKLIKIDKSMLDEVSSANGQIILEHTIRMMQCIGKRLVAEGAETTHAIELLRSMGCDYIQGFYCSKPLPSSEFVDFLKKDNR
jgi:EAL domain-containing protein (putative c-di-GMP-specific phosphodiesterase class I)